MPGGGGDDAPARFSAALAHRLGRFEDESARPRARHEPDRLCKRSISARRGGLATGVVRSPDQIAVFFARADDRALPIAIANPSGGERQGIEPGGPRSDYRLACTLE